MAEKDESELDGIDSLEIDDYGHEGEEEDELYEDVSIDEGIAPEGDDGGKGKGKGVAARYLLPDLPADVTEEDIIDYFGAIGEVEQATVRHLRGGQVMGSIKFLNPSWEIKKKMLHGGHQINGSPVDVQTWKMQKLNRPGYKASIGKGAMPAGAMKRAVGFVGYRRDDAGELVGRHGYEPRGGRLGTGVYRGFGQHEEHRGRYGREFDDIDPYGGLGDRRGYGEGCGGRYGFASRGAGGFAGEGPLSMRSRGIGGRYDDGFLDSSRGLLPRGPYGDRRPGSAPRLGGEGRGVYMDSIKTGRGTGYDLRRRYGGADVEPARPGAFSFPRVPPGFDDVDAMPRGGRRGYGPPPPDDIGVGPYDRPYNSRHSAEFSPGRGKELSMSAGKKGKEEEKDITARYLLSDLAADVTEDQLQEYFSVFGEIEDVTLRHLDSGKVVGSVKYLNPTVELRNLMLRESHEVNGCNVTVQTWKMQKLQKPNYGKGPASRPQKDREQRPEGNLRFRPY